METRQFDHLVSGLAETGTRRGMLRFLAAAVGTAAAVPLLAESGEARRKRRRKKKAVAGGGKALREICTPGQTTCAKGLQCGAPTTRHTCSSTVEGVESWCCVPPGGRCSECDCCGDYYCEYDDNNTPTCQPNPEN
jgi:hypothetical protein